MVSGNLVVQENLAVRAEFDPELTLGHLYGRQRKALTLVEVDAMRYRDASVIMGMKLENLKMVVCRARKKIAREITEIAECRA